MFPEEIGALCLMNASQDRVEVTLSWGESEERGIGTQGYFTPEECWALRRGRMHLVESTSAGLLCSHLPQPIPPAYVCIPLIAQGESLGILYLGFWLPGYLSR